MKYGMNMLLWTDNVTGAHLPVLEQLKDIGFDGVEVPLFDPSSKDAWATLGKQLSGLGLERTAVTICTAAANPIDRDQRVRQNAVTHLKRALDCCGAAGIKLLVGPFHSALGQFSGAGPTEDEIARSVEVMWEVADHARHCGVTLAVEYLNRFETYLLTSAAETVAYVSRVGHPNCKMMYDTFHANIEEKDIFDAICTGEGHIVHVHISENDRSTPGAGHVDWEATFDALSAIGYDGWLTIEAFGQTLPALVAATKIWRKMFVDEMQLACDGLAFMRKQVDARSSLIS